MATKIDGAMSIKTLYVKWYIRYWGPVVTSILLVLSQKIHFVWARFALSLLLQEPEPLTIFKWLVCKYIIDNYFCSLNFFLFLTLPGGLLSVHYSFYLEESYPRKYALIDTHNNCLSLKLTKPVNFVIPWCNLLLTPLLNV